MALDASAAVGHEHENSSSPRASGVGVQEAAVSSAGSSPSASSSTSSLGDGVGLQTVPLQRSRSASPKCFGALGSKEKKKAAPKGDVVSASPPTESRKGRRQRKNRRSPPAGNASVSGSSSPASSISSSSIGDRLGFRTSHQPPCFVSKLPRGSNNSSARARSPGKQEKTKGGGVGSYMREISRRLRRGGTEKSQPPTARIACTGGERKRGNAIASQEEMRAFVTASARIIERNGPPVLPLGLF
ncbi:hypothetical protein ZWY2020_006019 [Hordeum vulgare]|nr:hypothetical protein ZWY2020_006019 [Hordeum vulgare]